MKRKVDIYRILKRFSSSYNKFIYELQIKKCCNILGFKIYYWEKVEGSKLEESIPSEWLVLDNIKIVDYYLNYE